MNLRLPVLILIGMALGALVGALINAGWTAEHWASLGVYDAAAFKAHTDVPANEGAGLAAGALRLASEVNAFIGKAFIRCLRMIAVPIVVVSLVAGAAGIGDPRRLGRMGVKTIGLFFTTTVVAILIGLAIGNVARPGDAVSPEARSALAAAQPALAQKAITDAQGTSLWTLALNIIPANPFDALARGDMLQIIVFSILLGGALAMLPAARTRPILEALGVLTDALVKIIHGVLWLAPIAVFCLMAEVAAGLGVGVIKAAGYFCLLVVLGLALHMTLVYLPMIALLSRVGVGRFMRGIAPAQLVAFTTSSSSATLPVTMRCVRENLGASERTTSFVCSLGATINMDGTALYQALSALFVAQIYGMDLSVAQQATIVLMCTLSSIGAPGIPGGGIVMFVAVMQAAGIPLEGLAVILAVDRVLDLFRTVVNVTGDAAVAAVVDAGERTPSNGSPREG